MNNFLTIILIMLVAIFLTIINIEGMKFYYNDLKYTLRAQWQKIFYSLLNNNLLDNPSDKVNKIAIVTFENRKKDKYIELHNNNISAYCKKWNYDYLYYDTCIHNVYWCKMHFVLDALKSGKYDYVLWMDSDTIIKNKNISLDLIVNKYSSDIFVSSDGGIAAFCAGVFIIKNSPIGISYIEKCIDSYSDNCEIKSQNILRGFWSGLCYEQGIMNMLIFDKFYKYTTCLPSNIIYNSKLTKTNGACDYDTFILHLYVTDNSLREKCFARFVI
jgi:hypothetical protein